VDASDLELPLEETDGPLGVERAMRACAIREAYEEAGVLVALAAPVDDEPLASGRAQLLAGERSFAALASEHGWRLSGARDRLRRALDHARVREPALRHHVLPRGGTARSGRERDPR